MVERKAQAVAEQRLVDGCVPGRNRHGRRIGHDLADLEILEVRAADLDSVSGHGDLRISIAKRLVNFVIIVARLAKVDKQRNIIPSLCMDRC